ncbi:MAG: cytochrome P450 [Deltaproteobacteria bacterium]|nr:MAG: cytochrome P450 [Deltaproteobacteria bacterium]
MAATQSIHTSTRGVEAPLMRGHWLWGNLKDVREDVLGFFLKAMAQDEAMLKASFLSINVHLLFDPDAIHHVFVKNAPNYYKGTRGYEKLRHLLGNGLVTSEGDFWRRQRRIAQPAFHKKRLEGFATTMAQAAEDMSLQWEESAKKGEELDLAQEMMRLTLRIAGETLFSTDISKASDDFGKYLSIGLEHFNHIASHPVPKVEYLPLPSNLRFWHALRKMKKMTWSLIQERRKRGEDRGDLLSMFMLARDEETGEQMSDQQLLDEAFTMLGAGHETTANALAWTLYLMTQNPDALEKVAQEADRVFGDRLPTMDDFKELTYTKRVIQESMRLFPPVWAIAKTAREDDVINGYHVSAGTHVYVCNYANHRNPRYWDNPEEFRPERFTPEALEEQKKRGRTNFMYMPFSQGQRKCIGDHFAMLEAVLIFSMLARKFQFQLKPGAVVKPETTVTLRPKDGIPATLRLR